MPDLSRERKSNTYFDPCNIPVPELQSYKLLFLLRIFRTCFKISGRTQWLLFCKSKAFSGFYAADVNSFKKITSVSLCKMSITDILGCP